MHKTLFAEYCFMFFISWPSGALNLERSSSVVSQGVFLMIDPLLHSFYYCYTLSVSF
jgi:hypothetical protein